MHHACSNAIKIDCNSSAIGEGGNRRLSREENKRGASNSTFVLVTTGVNISASSMTLLYRAIGTGILPVVGAERRFSYGRSSEG